VSKELLDIDVTNAPELARVAEEVKATNTPRVLSRNSEPIAMVVPIRERCAPQGPTEADIAATMSSAGTWADVDAEALERQLREGRSDHRPTPRL